MHLLENLHIHSNKGGEKSEFAHVPKYTPTILKKLQENSGHHHHHVYHLRRRSLEKSSEDKEKGKSDVYGEESIFVPENGTEKRGIFRTMEPIWVCNIDAAPYHSNEANQDGLIILDNESQKILEEAFKNNEPSCTLSVDATTGHCTVKFDDGDKKTNISSLDSNDTIKSAVTTNIRHLVYGTDIQRMTTPVWWYEKSAIDGKKELCRFDWKNQMRLEAFDDDESTLSLTDNAFSEPFTVALNTYKERKNNEWQGFIYLDTVPRFNDTTDEEEDYHDLNIQGKDNFPNFNAFASEGEEQNEEESYRKVHIKR